MTAEMNVSDLDDNDFFNLVLPNEEVKEEKTEIIESSKETIEKQSDELSEDDILNINNSETKVENKKTTTQELEVDKDSFYKARIEYSKSIGRLPEDFELEDDVELDDSSFQKVMDYENEYVYEIIAAEVKKEYTEKLGTNVIGFLENGGDISKIAELIKEESKIVELNTSVESGQKAIIKAYYSSPDLDWSDTKINKHIDRLLNDDELEEEAIELKTKLEKNSAKKQESLVKKQEVEFQKREALEKKQINDFATVLEERGLTKKAVDEYVNYAFKEEEFNGYKMSKLDFKFLQIQKKPNELIELIEFVSDKDQYIKKKAIEINNPKVDKTFETILKNKTKIKGSSSNSLPSSSASNRDWKY